MKSFYITLCFCAIFKLVCPFPVIQPVIVLPPQSLIQFQVPLLTQYQMAAQEDDRRILRHHNQGSSAKDHPQLKHNGHQNPQNTFDRADVIQSNRDDNIDVEPETEIISGYGNAVNENINGKLSVGDLITAIPWLPLEINVPDTIAWIYNGIAGVIGGIGQRLPFINNSSDEPRPSKMVLVPVSLLQVPMQQNKFLIH